jgi:hypothetical protein
MTSRTDVPNRFGFGFMGVSSKLLICETHLLRW